ncbi:urease accessory protein UreF [Blautia sp. MSJ-19]|uniref:urease accessory protein UreF n=1 Tax=Blautia sp. MSJ-19 TaxID=2841517 RepID=UPI001C0E96EE|nr:urease accessory protein UreF [Blautia sp. MSJ-19]MBU5480581.1 urease accessory protein UreF [Blautia sp. MSJ-19]
MTEGTAKFFLLQVNDALFPIGGYSHSYGLETYIQKGIVHDEDSAEEFIHKRLEYNFLYNEFLAVRLGWEYAVSGDLAAISRLEEIMEAGKIPRETREASRKLGSRFIKTLSALEIPRENRVFEEYREARKGKSVHHAVAYGVFCGAAGITREEALEHFLYAQTSAMVTNCVKTIPLSQSSGQKLLSGCYPLLQKLTEEVTELGEEWLGLSGPGFDLRCMQHEGLYSRIYMS